MIGTHGSVGCTVRSDRMHSRHVPERRMPVRESMTCGGTRGARGEVRTPRGDDDAEKQVVDMTGNPAAPLGAVATARLARVSLCIVCIVRSEPTILPERRETEPLAWRLCLTSPPRRGVHRRRYARARCIVM